MYDVCKLVCTRAHVDNLVESVLSSHLYVGSGDQIRLPGLCCLVISFSCQLDTIYSHLDKESQWNV